MTSIFGPLVARGQVAQAVADLLSTPPAGSVYPLVVYYLAEVERQQSLDARSIPVPADVILGLDFENWDGAELPLLIVVAQPAGDAERYGGDGSYGQWYEIQVAAIVEEAGSGNEQAAQALADQYGAAIEGLLVQQGALGSPAAFTVEKTLLVSAAKTEFLPAPAQRWLALSVVTIHSFVQQVVGEEGPGSFGPDPYVEPGDWPEATVVEIEFQTEDTLGNVAPATGVTVVDGGVVVTE